MISGTSAGFGRRIAALIYDGFLLAALLMLYTAVVIGPHGRAVTEKDSGSGWYVYRAGELLIIAAYFVLNWTRSGQTLGMRAWHLHAVSAAGRPLTLRAALARFLWALLAWAPAGLGVLWLYVDSERLALHDRLSKTRLVHVSQA
ncbi:MAG TPA: RDD family protein [Steroidobacteraceae bacterium]|nr:RDD family protein [Steroidobacteraceae bacterium]